MAKKPNTPADNPSHTPADNPADNPTETMTTTADPPVPPPAPLPAAEPSALATTQGAALAPAEGDGDKFDPLSESAVADLVKVFPTEEKYLRQIFVPVRDEVLDEALAGLSDAQQQAFAEAMARMNPVRAGDHRRQASSFKLYDLRIYQGTGNDESKPKLAPPGSIYSTDGRILAAGDPDQAALLRVPEKFAGYVISIYEGNTFWPPREDQGGQMPEGVEDTGGAPICRSLDGEKGNRYGSCAACTYRPFIDKKPNRGACTSSMFLIVVPTDFSGVYRFGLSGMSNKAGRAMKKKMDAGWRSIWEHPFLFGTKKEIGKDDPNKRWFSVDPSAQPGQPSDGEKAVLALLCRRYETEVYWPERRRIYLSAAQSIPEKPHGEANLTSLMALAKGAVAAPAAPATAAKAPTDKSRNNL